MTYRSKSLLRSYLVESAWVSVRRDPTMQDYYRSHKGKQPNKIIIKVAHKLTNTFGKPIIPENEELRFKALEYFDILNSLPDQYFNNVARIIATAFNTPIALVSLVGREDVFFKGNFGMEGIDTVDRGQSLCSLAILDPNPTIFKDALEEPCLLKNPLVAGSFGLRFYAGAPIITKEGFNIGTVCIVDKHPREFSAKDSEILQLFAENAMYEIEMRGKIKYLK